MTQEGPSDYRHLALVPLMNAGGHCLSEFDFSCGAKLRIGRPGAVMEALPHIRSRFDVSRSEAMCFDLAAGWLWVASDEPSTGLEGDRSVIQVCASLRNVLSALVWCIDLAGCGENSYWRYAGLLNSTCVYLHSVEFPGLPGLLLREHHLESTPRSELRDVPWSKERLTLADELHNSFQRLVPRPVPRLLLANQLRWSMMRWDVRSMNLRFSQCGTALETFFVSPAERRYFWDVPERVAQACPSLACFGTDFFDRYRVRRNDTVHRAGMSEDGKPPATLRVDMQAEVLLREALVWGVLNHEPLADAFEGDSWPENVPPLEARWMGETRCAIYVTT